MKRVLYVEGCRDGTVGGSHTCLYYTVTNLDRQRFHPIVVFYKDHAVAEALRRDGVEVRVLPNEPPLDVVPLLRRLAPPLERVAPAIRPVQKAVNLSWHFLRPAVLHAWHLRRDRIDILHLNNSIKTNHDWMLAGRMAGVKVISHERGISDELSPTAKFFGRSVDLLICMSKVIRDPLVRHGLPSDRAIVIYDGLDTSRIVTRTPPGDVRAALGIGPGDPVIGVVGNLKQWKGQETVVRATALLKSTWPALRCLLVGGAVEGDTYRDRLLRLVDELGLQRNVVFTGFQNNPADFVNVMDVVIHSSILPEPFGMVNLEAMYLKKPVISTSIGGPTEIFEDGVTGLLIEPGNPAMLADRVSLLLSDPDRRLRTGLAAHHAVLSTFTIAETVRQIQGTYDRLLGA